LNSRSRYMVRSRASNGRPEARSTCRTTILQCHD
jgi:hypothetical protein